MPPRGDDSGFTCPGCGGMLIDVLDNDWQKKNGQQPEQFKRIRRCASCWGTHPTREVLFGTFRPGVKPIDTVDLSEICDRRSDLPGQLLLDDLLFDDEPQLVESGNDRDQTPRTIDSR